MNPRSAGDFNARAHLALNDAGLRAALDRARDGFVTKRARAVSEAGDFEILRDAASGARERALRNLDLGLARFRERLEAAGGHVHWASTPADMRRIVVDLCRERGAEQVVFGKSMIGEEADLRRTLEAEGIAAHETDLGEYVIQLAGERPSHIIAPALHKSRDQVRRLFEKAHDLGRRDLSSTASIVDEARAVMRRRFSEADVGITGANMLIAETGTAAVVSNEGNADLTALTPKTHIVVASMEKIVLDWEDAAAVLRVLARSATGQTISAYTSFFSPDPDGEREFHVVLLDGGRSEILAGEYRDILRCIRCGACLNHCPVYQNVGGAAYDSVYPGPLGSVLKPLLQAEAADYELAEASSFCGRCEEVCPVRIPLPDLMRRLRARRREVGAGRRLEGLLIAAFCRLAERPRLYAALSRLGVGALSRWGRLRGRIFDFAPPAGDTFQRRWRKR